VSAPRPWHPLFFAAFPLLSLWAHNLGHVSPGDVVPPAAVVFGATFLAYWPLRWITGCPRKASLLLSLGLVACFFYGHVFSWRENASPVVYALARDRFLLPLWFAVCGAAAWRVHKTPKSERLTQVANTIGLILVLLPAAQIAMFAAKTSGADVALPETQDSAEPARATPTATPDVYYIVLDRYAGAATLKEFYGYDNSAFLERLSAMGFYVAAQSHSNYLKTAHSLASSLNLEYLDTLQQAVGAESNDWRPLHRRVADYRVWRLLKARGYRYIHFGSWWDFTRENKFADENYNLYPLPQFSATLLESTVLWPFASRLGIASYANRRLQWERIRFQFAKLGEIAAAPGPKFVFAHFLIPHPPYVFGPKGEFVEREVARQRSRRENYLNQLAYVNRAVLATMERILRDSPARPVIILQSDEGPWPERYEAEELKFDWRQATPAELKEKTEILNAYFLPGVGSARLQPAITPVNSFRVVFNLYFDEKFELLPDEIFAHANDTRPYSFFRITEKVPD
jgi:hypothetical protein